MQTHRHILNSVWGPAHGEDAQCLRVFVRRLRQRIEVDPSDPRLILTEAGVGYRLAAPKAADPAPVGLTVPLGCFPCAQHRHGSGT